MTKNIYILGTLIAVTFFLIVGVVIRYTGAADVPVTVVIGSSVATVDSVRFATTAYGADDLTATGILPNVGNTRTVHVNGVISDLNGEETIASSTIALTFHRTSVTNACVADNNNCYKVVTCATDYATGDNTQIAYNCPVDIAYFIDATDSVSASSGDSWTAYLSVVDTSTATASRNATIEVNSLLALDLPTVINYGARSLGEQSTSTTNIHTTIIQHGNTNADVQVSGTYLDCDVFGSLATSSQAWAVTDVDYASSTQLTDSLVETDTNMETRTSETVELSKILYWNIAIPATGVEGTCTGTNTMIIISDPSF